MSMLEYNPQRTLEYINMVKSMLKPFQMLMN